MDERIGRYQILEEIASGGQGAVYRAFDPESGQIVAVKELHPSLTGNRDYLERFRREASLASSIDHPNVVKIFEVGEDKGKHFMALEFLPESLARVIQGAGALSVERTAVFGIQIAEGLAAAHALGIVHRDIKPQNVLIGPDGTAKLTDFGIAHAELLPTMTATGAIMGTPHYMSPEQARGERADKRSDVYSLGCMLYQMLTGEVPFKGNALMAVVRKHIEERPRPMRQVRSDVPPAVERVIGSCMEKSPDRRYQTPVEVALALKQAVPGAVPARSRRETPIPERPPPPQAPPSAREATPPSPPARQPRAEASPAPPADPATNPSWSPDGTRIAFIRGGFSHAEIYVMNADGSGETKLTNDMGSVWWDPFSWSPDGARIAFVSNRNGSYNMYVMSADGSAVRNLTNNVNNHESPCWSPDGARIAFVPNLYDISHHEDISVREDISELCVMNADGSGLTRLTEDAEWDSGLSWSPDGARIAFVRGGDKTICVMNADGSGLTRLTNNRPWMDYGPSWSPDGTRIAFKSHRDGYGHIEIYVMSPDGSGVTRLTNQNEGAPLYLSWSPDGARIAFVRSDYLAIYAMSADGSGLKRPQTTGSTRDGLPGRPTAQESPSSPSATVIRRYM